MPTHAAHPNPRGTNAEKRNRSGHNRAQDRETARTMLSEEDMKHASLLQDLMEQPLMEAREKARKEGIQLGINNLIDVLDARFQDQDVDLYKPIFEAITDLQLLKQLHRTALRAPTFDDVMQTLKDYRNNGA